jgi:hypothetical protein
VNKLKHQQARLRGIAVWTNAGAHLGYFVEEPDKEGLIGPSEDINPDRGCISFARDLPWHLFSVYRHSARLAEAVRRALNSLHGITVKPEIVKPNEKWHRAVNQACKLPEKIFPMEVPKHIARLRLSDDGQVLTVNFPQHIQLRFPPTLRATCSLVMDGNSPSYKVPLP